MTEMMKTGNFTCDLADLAARVPRISRLLGVDVGAKRIGVAISDPGRLVGNPLRVIKRDDRRSPYSALKDIVAEAQIGGIIIGYPLHLSGGEGRACQAVRAFCRNLYEDLQASGASPPIALWDERMSTQMSQRMLTEEADLSRDKRRAVVDAVAASLILQSALDYLRQNESINENINA